MQIMAFQGLKGRVPESSESVNPSARLRVPAGWSKIISGWAFLSALCAASAAGSGAVVPSFIGAAGEQAPGSASGEPFPRESENPAAPFEWRAGTAEGAGISHAELDSFRAHLADRKTKALLLILNDRIVCEWYAPDHSATKRHFSASMAKALVGGISAGIALCDGRLSLDDPAAMYIPQWRLDTRKSRITLRQLGSHTSGLEDAEEGGLAHHRLTGWKADFWKRLPPPRDPFTLSRDATPVLPPPAEGSTEAWYSNPGIAMLGYATTAALKEAPEKDLRTLLRERVMRPLSIPDDEWSVGYGETVVVDGLPLVAAWGGGSFTARAAARLGRLMLREGDWDGRRLMTPESVRAITSDAGTPGNGTIGWWSNNDGPSPAMPRDAYWAAGAGGQVLLVVPSLKLIAVRNGGPLAEGDNNRALREHFFLPLMKLFSPFASAAAPEPARPLIRKISWGAKDSIVRRAQGGDNWPMTWADDDALYTAYGDGFGFEPFVPEKLGMGLAKVMGAPPDFHGINLRAPSIESRGGGASGHKASGLLMADGVLYLLARNVGNARLAWSGDHGRTWTWADWKLTESFGAPTFINFGRNHAGARDEFIYVVSHDAGTAYHLADAFVLARAPRDGIKDPGTWEFFSGMRNGRPGWTHRAAGRAPILTAPGECYRAGVSYNAGLERYLLVHPVPSPESFDSARKIDTRFTGGLAIYEASEPWGPWNRVFHTDNWDVGPGETASFPTKWMSDDGRTLHLVFSGDDYFSVRQATLALENHR